EPPGVAHGGVEVDPVGGLGQVLALDGEGPQPPAQRAVGHRPGVALARRVGAGLVDRARPSAVLHHPAPPPRRPRSHGSLAAFARAGRSGVSIIMSSCRWVTLCPRWPPVGSGNPPTAKVWK